MSRSISSSPPDREDAREMLAREPWFHKFADEKKAEQLLVFLFYFIYFIFYLFFLSVCLK
jgi:hypothetical protein